MREVAKSVLGLSWAVSLFGFQQLSRALTPATTQPCDVTASEVDDVSRAVQSRLSESAAQQFRAGDEWQRRMVDIMFDLASLRVVDPRKMVEVLDPRTLIETTDPRGMMETGVTVIQKSVDTAMDAARRAVDSVRPAATT